MRRRRGATPHPAFGHRATTLSLRAPQGEKEDIFPVDSDWNNMRQVLKPHPDSRCDAVAHVAVDVTRERSGVLALRYVVTGKIGSLNLPQKVEPTRADELWRHTCFEAFIHIRPDEAYSEFNFSPSRQWAVYRFDGYRTGMRIASGIVASHIETAMGDASYELRVSLALDRMIDLLVDAPWQIGLSAVIEEKSGRKSWWALAHPPGKPDFHHSDCFALALAAPSEP